MQKRLEITNSFRNPLQHFLMLASLFVLSACGEAVENLEERLRQEKLASTSIITSVSPAFGSIAGGGTLTINGTNLDLVTNITLDDGTCSVVTISSSIITCTLSSASAGLKNILINNSKGENYTFNNGYRYLAAPTVSAISPAVGAITGSESVTLTGTGFYQISAIDIGGTACTSVTTVSETTATCTTGVSLGGTFDVNVTNADSQIGTLSNGFVYVDPPTISTFSPTTIMEIGSETLTINGSNFDGSTTANTVTIDGFDCPVLSNTGTVITCTTIPYTSTVGNGTDRWATGGSQVSVVVTNADGGSDTTTIEYVPAVTLSSNDISFGAVGGGDTIVLTGNWIDSGGSFDVTVAGVSCASTSSISRTSITCVTASQTAQTGDIVVTNFDGQTATLSNAFTYRPAPTVTSVTDNNGPESGGNTVTVTGTGFDTSGNFTVLFGAQLCTNITSVTATTFDCDVPANTAGVYNVTVTNTDDNQVGVGIGEYTYNPAPTITDVTTPIAPLIDYGPIAGGNTIEVQGTNFQAGLTIELTDEGGTNQTCTNLNNLTATSVECDVPAVGAGTLSNVTVTNPDGQAFTGIGEYTYVPAPDITSIDIPAGPINGGQNITLAGAYFQTDMDIQINGQQCVISSYVSDNEIVCTTPDNTTAGGPYNVDVTNQDGQTDSLATAYEFINAPTVITSTPTSGFTAGGTTISVTGTGFYTSLGITVTIDGLECTNVQNLTTTSFDCDTPAHAAGEDYAIVVENNVDGQTGTSGLFFDFIGPPTLTNIYESTGTTIIDGGNDAGGYKVRLIGTDFQTGMVVDIGAQTQCAAEGLGATDSQFIDNTTFDCYVPAGAWISQTESLTLTNLDTQTTTAANVFSFRPAPTFTSVTPDYGDPAGGNTVRILGANFTATNMRVTINSLDCTTTTYVDSNNLDCVVPAGSVATGLTLEVINDGDLQTTGAVGSFDYINPPAITSITVPNPLAVYGNENIAAAGGDVITINGTDLMADATVLVNGSACPTTGGGTEPTSFVCTTPAGTGTDVVVSFTNADGQADTSQLDYIAAPTLTGYNYSYGPTTGGNVIEIQGTDFQAGVNATINGNLCTGTANVTTTTFDCTIPADGGAGVGAYDVIVVNEDTQVSATDVGAFSYVADPSVTSFSPTTLYDSQSQTLTITGTDFYDNALVTIGGNTCTVTSITSPTTIVCTTPATNTGAGLAVVVTNESGQDNTADSETIDSLPAPTIVSMSTPTDTDGGRDDGSQTLTIIGTNFITADLSTTVSVNGSACTVTAVPDANTVECTTVATAAGTGTVTVTNPDGQASAAYSSFTYHPTLTLTTITPSGGSTAGGDTLVVNGTGLRDSTNGGGVVSVVIDGGTIGCTVSSVAGDGSSVTCTVDAGPHTPGDYDVTVTNGDGRSATLVGVYKVAAAPTVTGVSPTTATESLATALTITGTGFQTYGTAPTVTVDGETCTGVSVSSDTSLTCTTAPSATTDTTRMVEVIVENADTQQGSDSSAFLQYIARPNVDSIDVSVVATAGGETITLTGTNFVAGATITVGVPCASVNDTGVPTTLVCTTDAASAGTYDIVVTNPDGQVDDDTNNVTVSPPPTVSSISDNYDVIGGGKSVVISGSDFASATVTLAGAACAVTTQNTTSITCTVGAVGADTVGDVVVTNGNGITGTLSNGFEYEDTPTFTALTDGTDDSGSVNGGEAITITGDNFANGVSVTIDGNSCTSLIRSNATSLTCTTPAGAVGAVDVIISNQSAASTVTQVNGYTYLAAAPTVTSISPQGGDTGGGTTVTITGTNFVSGATVTIGNACTSYDYSGVPTTIVCDTASNGSQSFENVVVTNPDTSTDTLSNGFLFTDAPTVTNISPSTGSTVGGTTVTITGTNFSSGQYSVNIGGIACGSISHTSTTSFTCEIGASVAGTYDVNVVQFFQTATLSSSFTYANGANLSWQVGASSPNPPDPADYGSQTTNVAFTFTLENTGPSATTADLAVSITGADSSLFSITNDNCSGTSLASAGTCTVDVTFLGLFAPSGTFNAVLDATASDGGTTTNALQGTKP